jgi:hypothetical protein
MTPRKELRDWDDAGVTITFEHRRTGEVRTVVSPGKGGTRTRGNARGRREPLAAALVSWDPADWRVRCISSPQTIYDDLAQPRKRQEGGSGDYGKIGARSSRTVRPATPEASMLAHIPGGSAYL